MSRNILFQLLIFLIAVLFTNCGIKRNTFSQPDNTPNSKNITRIYNTDSSCVVITEGVYNTNGLPEKFYLVNNSNNDTIYRNQNDYAFIMWEGDHTILIRKPKGIIGKDNRYEFSETEESFIDYYLNIQNLEIAPIHSKSKQIRK